MTTTLPNGDVLVHGKKVYDAAKAHDYYMRTRKLKGRKKGVTKTPVKQQRKQSPQARKIERLRKRAEQSRARLQKRLTRLLEQVEGTYPIPEGANPALRKLIMGLRSKTGKMIKEKGASDREKIATDLKAAIDKARKSAKAKVQTATKK